MALQSQLFRGDPKLEAAANSDPGHILPGSKGPHAGQIQQALIQLDGAVLTLDSVYGPATSAAVLAFKQKRRILNREGKIDNIVGIKTMAALDAELLAQAQAAGGGGSLRLGFQISIRTKVDFVIVYKGGGGAPARNEGFASTGLNLDEYRKKTDRRLVLIGRGGAFLDQKGALTDFRPMDEDFRTIRQELDSEDSEVGAIFIRGSSSGGKAALNLAALLTGEKIPIRFVGIEDAAFFHADTANVPLPGSLSIPKVPFFALNSPVIRQLFRVDAAEKHNFWQDKQNRGQIGFGGLFWTSSLNGEVHGTLRDSMGFLDFELTGLGNNPHGETVDRAVDRNIRTINDALRAL